MACGDSFYTFMDERPLFLRQSPVEKPGRNAVHSLSQELEHNPYHGSARMSVGVCTS